MFKRKNLQANIDFLTNKKRKFFNRKTGAILGGLGIYKYLVDFDVTTLEDNKTKFYLDIVNKELEQIKLK